jgi:hypothetical protein
MRLRFKLIKALAPLAIACCGLPGLAQAGTLSYQGQFSTDDQLFVTHFVLAAEEPVTAHTLGYAGGTNAAGASVAAGGFAPVLALFLDGFGLLDIARGSSQVCGPGAGAADPVSGFCWDAGFSSLLPAGSYTLVLSQDGNEPLGLTPDDGYTQTGQPDYTGLAFLGQPGAMFIQVDGRARTGGWALDVQAASVPEPGTWLALLLGLATLALRRLATANPA